MLGIIKSFSEDEVSCRIEAFLFLWTGEKMLTFYDIFWSDHLRLGGTEEAGRATWLMDGSRPEDEKG